MLRLGLAAQDVGPSAATSTSEAKLLLTQGEVVSKLTVLKTFTRFWNFRTIRRLACLTADCIFAGSQSSGFSPDLLSTGSARGCFLDELLILQIGSEGT